MKFFMKMEFSKISNKNPHIISPLTLALKTIAVDQVLIYMTYNTNEGITFYKDFMFYRFNQTSNKESSEPLLDSSIKESSEPLLDSSIKESSEPLLDSSIKESSEPLLDSSIKESSEPLLDSSIKEYIDNLLEILLTYCYNIGYTNLELEHVPYINSELVFVTDDAYAINVRVTHLPDNFIRELPNFIDYIGTWLSKRTKSDESDDTESLSV